MNGSGVSRQSAFAVLAVLGVLVAVNVPTLGSDPWPFRPEEVDPRGVLGPLVRAADEGWDLGLLRSVAMLAGVLIVAVALAAWRVPRWREGWLVALCAAVVALLVVPAVLLQVGLRDATEPWLHVNDSTYQIELAGDLVLDGRTPYGHDYTGSGLERFYESVPRPGIEREVALEHFAYFPGTPLTAAAWNLVPSPFDDYRVFVLLCTLGCFVALLLFQAPAGVRLALGAALAAGPLLLRGAWFGTADAPSLLCLLLAFALLQRRRYRSAVVLLAAAVLLKQFAVVAVPFFALMLVRRAEARRRLVELGAIFAGVLLAGFLPFLVADAGALWDDTVGYGTGTYRILGYGLSAILFNLGVIDDRYDPYPFAILALVVWLPVTLLLLRYQRRSGSAWEGAAGFAISVFVLLFIARVFQTSYLIWPLTGIALAAVLAFEPERARAAPARRPRRGR
jgi:hypothetical protein